MAQLISGTTIDSHVAIHAGNLSAHSIATTSYVTTQINNLINGAPGALDTLNELAAALGNDASFSSTITSSIAGKLSLSGGTMTGAIVMSGTQQIKHAGYSGIEYYNAGAQWQGYIGTENNTGNLRYNSYSGSHTWYANNVQKMGLDSSGNLSVTGTLSASGYNASNWNTAYGWGNHASAGYLTSLPAHNHDGRYLLLSGGTLTGDLLSTHPLYPGYNNGAVGSQGSYYLYGDTGNSGIRTNSNFLANGDIYLGTRGQWLSTYLNQAVRTDSAPSFSSVYLGGSQLTGTQVNGLSNMLGVTTLPYSCDITVGGDPDRFYAVQFWGGDQDVWRRIIIKRGYSEPAPWDPIGTGVHHGGLLLDWEGNFGGWGGAEYADRLRVFNESYTNVCADMFIYSHSMSYVFMLRGGGAVYHLFSDQPINGFYQSGAPDILLSSDTLSYDDNWSGTNQYDVYAPAPLGLGSVNSSRIDGLRTKKQSLLDGRYAAISHSHTFASLTSKPTTISGYGITDAITTGNIGSQTVATAGALTSMNISQFTNNSGYLTSVTNISGNAGTVTHNASRTDGTRYNIGWFAGNPSPAYSCDAVQIRSSDGTVFATSYRGSGNVSGTGEAIHAPAGLYSTGTNWLYGTIYMNNNIISDVGNITMISNVGIQYSTTHWIRPRDSSGNLHIKADSGGIYLDADIIHFRAAGGSGDTTISGGVYSGNISGNAATATNVAWTGVTSRPTALSQFTNDLGNYGGWITGYTETIGTNNTSGVAGAKYQINDTWLRVNSDNRQFQIYGNARSIIYRTDGATNDHGGGEYPHIFYYGGSTDDNRIVIFRTNGDIWMQYAGDWMSNLLAAKSNTGHTHDDRYYTETEVNNFFSAATAITGYNKSNWDAAYNKRPTAISFSGTGTKTLTLTQGDGSTLTANFSDIDTDTNTDGQTLSINGSTLSISGGNSITIPSGGISQGTADALYVNVSGDTMTGPLNIVGSSAGQDLFAVNGVYGRLFTVTDDFSDSIFSANTISGLPVIEAFADYSVKIGTFNRFNIVTSGDSVAINSNVVDPRFPFYVGDRSTSTSRYYLTSPGMGFNLSDNYAQFQLYGTAGAYIDFVYGTATDYNGRIMYSTNGEFVLNSSTTIQGTVYTSSHGNSSQWNDKATHRGEGTNYVDYARYVYNNGAYSGTGWNEPSDLGVRYANTSGSISGFNNPTTAATANTIAYRDGSGDLTVRELVLNVAVQSFTPSSIVAIYPTTNQAVKANAAGVQAFLGLGSMAYASTGSYLPLSGGTMTGTLTITSTDIRSNASSGWTGDPGAQGKIQYHSNRWYIVSDESSDRIVQFRRNGSDVSHIANDGTFNGSITGTASNITAYTINQSVGTGNSPTFVDVYANEWFRNNNNLEGLYNQANGNHFYSRGGSIWGITGNGGSVVHLQFRLNHESTLKGSVYGDTAGFGLLDSSDSWRVRVDTSGAQVYGTLTVGNTTSSNIIMTDTDETSRTIHCNSGRIGFLTSGGSWGAYADNSGNWSAANFSGSSSGTNTGDQTNISGNAATATSASYARYLPNNYNGDVRTNPQSYFDYQQGLNVAMTGAWSVWSDTLWINGYSGSDVPWMCALHFLRNSEPRMAISAQTREASAYGTYYEVITAYNIASQSVSYASTAGNTNSISSAVGGSYTWTSTNYFRSNLGATSGSLSSPPLQVYCTGGNSAFMSFHRSGNYAVNFGLDSDNVLRMGGWSATANRWQLDMSGNMTVAGDVTAFSDARVKTNVQTIEHALDKTLALRGVSYNRTDSDDTRTKIGVIAQETLEVLPEVVNQDNSGMYNVSYGNMTALLIEAIKEQQAQIEDLKLEVKKLRGE